MAAPDTLDQRFAEAMGQLLGPDFPPAIALAVSGGGDSMAMLALAHGWARVWGVRLRVVTVDHGLRAESAAEAAMVATECAALGHPHATLRWHWDGHGNVMDAARRGRLALIDRWRHDIAHVLMAHTADDVAESFLIRLARGSGVDGLAAMQARRRVREGFEVIRPCLDMSRAELRHHARTLKVPWVEDPTNDDPKYDRARARKLLPLLEEFGLGAQTLTATAGRMRRASDALHARLRHVAAALAQERAGVLICDREAFAQIERDTQLRLLAAGCMWVGQAEYRPRAEALEGLLDRLLAGGAGTLIGAKAQTDASRLMIFREYAAVAQTEAACPQGATVWDRRWHVRADQTGDAALTIRALGEAVRACPDWRSAGLPRAALMATPAVFAGKRLVAAPVLDANATCSARLVAPFADFLLSH